MTWIGQSEEGSAAKPLNFVGNFTAAAKPPPRGVKNSNLTRIGQTRGGQAGFFDQLINGRSFSSIKWFCENVGHDLIFGRFARAEIHKI